MVHSPLSGYSTVDAKKRRVLGFLPEDEIKGEPRPRARWGKWIDTERHGNARRANKCKELVIGRRGALRGAVKP